MSKISDLGAKHEKLPDVLGQYIKDLDDLKDIVRLKGKKLEVANRENPAWYLYYRERKVELGTLVKYFEGEVSRIRGKLYREYKERYSIDLGEREIGRYIDHDEKYLTLYHMLLEVKEIHDQYDGAVDTLTTRGYALNNITKIRVAGLEDAEL